MYLKLIYIDGPDRSAAYNHFSWMGGWERAGTEPLKYKPSYPGRAKLSKHSLPELPNEERVMNKQ